MRLLLKKSNSRSDMLFPNFNEIPHETAARDSVKTEVVGSFKAIDIEEIEIRTIREPIENQLANMIF